MRRYRQWIAIGVGVGATIAGLVLAVRRFEPAAPDADPGSVVWLIGLGGLAAAAWLLYEHSRTRSSEGPVPWSEAGPIVEEPPEAVTQQHPLSGSNLAAALIDAGVAARESREIEAGVAVVRPLLGEAYLEAMVAGGRERAGAEADLDAGSWTDDRVAATVLSPEVEPPSRSLRRRIVDWLYPGRAVTRRTVRAVSAVTRAGDEALSPVVGSDAPRRVPTYEPSLAVRAVGADGRVRDRSEIRTGTHGLPTDGKADATTAGDGGRSAESDGAEGVGGADDTGVESA